MAPLCPFMTEFGSG